MELLLIRHGDAAMVAGPDDLRPLTSHGEAQVTAMADYLSQSEWKPELLLLSPYVRAQSTARRLKALWPEVRSEDCELLTPDASIQALLDFLDDRHAERAVLVSHNPLMSNLLNYLIGDKSSRVFGTASVARLDMEWLGQGCADLRWMRHPPDYIAAE